MKAVPSWYEDNKKGQKKNHWKSQEDLNMIDTETKKCTAKVDAHQGKEIHRSNGTRR